MPENLVFEPSTKPNGIAWIVYKEGDRKPGFALGTPTKFLGTIELRDGVYVFKAARRRSSRRRARERWRTFGPTHYTADDLSAIAARINQLSLSGYDGAYGKDTEVEVRESH